MAEKKTFDEKVADAEENANVKRKVAQNYRASDSYREDLIDAGTAKRLSKLVGNSRVCDLDARSQAKSMKIDLTPVETTPKKVKATPETPVVSPPAEAAKTA